MLSNVLQAFSPAIEGFAFMELLGVVFVAGLWTAATKRFAWTARFVKVSLILGGLGGLYRLANAFTVLGRPDIAPESLKMKENFPLMPASNGPLWLFLGLSLFLCALLALVGSFAYASRHVHCEVSPEGLRIAGDLYGRRIPLAVLGVDGAKVVDLHQDRAYQLRWRTNGAGLPGYSAGWFRLRNGEKALVFVTDKRRVLYLPTQQGYVVLLSVANPDALLRALRQASPHAVSRSS